MAIVTGAGSGIGRAIAVRFAMEGASVVVNDLNARTGKAVRDEIRKAGGEASFFGADVSRAAEIRRMAAFAAKTYGSVQVLVNNAICGIRAITEEDLSANTGVILGGAWNCSRAVLPLMKKSGGGSIIHISSVNALMGGKGGILYSAIKGALISLGRCQAIALSPFQVRVNILCPGTIQTNVWNPHLKKDPKLLKKLATFYPLGRIGQPDDIANAALWLASDEAAWVTGTVIPIDGGLTARIPIF